MVYSHPPNQQCGQARGETVPPPAPADNSTVKQPPMPTAAPSSKSFIKGRSRIGYFMVVAIGPKNLHAYCSGGLPVWEVHDPVERVAGAK